MTLRGWLGVGGLVVYLVLLLIGVRLPAPYSFLVITLAMVVALLVVSRYLDWRF
jgi:hypothetical protein